MNKFLEEEDLETETLFINRKNLEIKKITEQESSQDNSVINNSISELKEKNLTDKEISAILAKQEKAKNVLNLIGENKKIINEINISLKKDLANFNFEVDVSEDPLVLKAVKNIFKKPNKVINYEMYLYAKQRLNDLYKTKIEEGLNE